VGDASYGRDNIEVTVEGAAPYVITSLGAGVFDTTVTTAGATADDDGVINVTIRDLGGDYYWVINGIDIWDNSTTDPGVQPLLPQAGSSNGTDGQNQAGVQVANLTDTSLQPIVSQAVAQWAASGLNAIELDYLSSFPVQVTDLSARGVSALGITTPEGVFIDSRAAGQGWHLDGSTSPATDRVDLLTVVMHELGHVLGHDHDDDHDSLMASHLSSGTRRPLTSESLLTSSPTLATGGLDSHGRDFGRLGAGGFMSGGLVPDTVESRDAWNSLANHGHDSWFSDLEQLDRDATTGSRTSRSPLASSLNTSDDLWERLAVDRTSRGISDALEDDNDGRLLKRDRNEDLVDQLFAEAGEDQDYSS